MSGGLDPGTWQWLAQQGVLGIVLLLVLLDYKRTYQRLVAKLEEDKGTLLKTVVENTEATIELRASVDRWARVVEESNPRWRGTGRGSS